MKEGWKYFKLGEVATFSRGLTYSKKDEADYSDNIVLRSNNVDLASGKLILDELKYLKSDFIIPEDKYVKKGSLLMCMSNGSKIHLGKVALIEDEKKYAFGGFMGLVTPNESIDSKFLYYALSAQNYKDFINSLSAGANINNIKVRDLEKFVIPIPPLSEQQRIVSRLDASFAKIDALSKQAEEALEHAKALFQAELKKLMEKKDGWKEKKLGDLCKDIRYGTSIPSNENGDYKYLRMNNVTNDGFLDISHYKTISLPEKELEKCLVKKGDIIFNRTNSPELVGKSCVFTSDEPMVIAGYLIRIRLIEGLNPQFITYYMNRQRVIGNMKPFIVGAVHQANISAKNIQKLVINFPSLEEQQKIVQTLDSLSQKISQLQLNYNQTLANCQALKQALLKETFE